MKVQDIQVEIYTRCFHSRRDPVFGIYLYDKELEVTVGDWSYELTLKPFKITKHFILD